MTPVTNATLTAVSAAQDGDLTYTGEPQTATVAKAATAVNNQAVTFTYSDDEEGTFTADVPAFTNAGTYTVYYKATAANHAQAAGSFEVVIAKKAATINVDNVVKAYTYDGTVHTVNSGATTDGDGAISYANNTLKEAGTYTVTVNVAEGANYLAATTTVEVKINEKAPTTTEDGVKEYEKEISVADATSETGSDVTVLFKNAKADAAETKEVKMTVGTSTVAFDAAAIDQLGTANSVAFKLNVITEAEALAAAIAANDKLAGAEMIIDVTMGNATFENGKATLTFDFAKTAPKGMIGKVYHVDADGNRTDMKAKFANGKVSFETTHFSDYIVVFEKAPGLSGGAIAGIVIACVVVAAGIAVGVFFLLKKKKGNGGSATPTETTAAEAAAE